MSVSIEELTKEIQDFVHERDWEQFHSPKDMAVAISGEAGELMHHFIWKSSEESHEIAINKRKQVADEMADIAILLFEFAANLDLDLASEIRAKLDRNQQRYPVSKAKGNNLKYDEFNDNQK